jgi:hypothetical protein
LLGHFVIGTAIKLPAASFRRSTTPLLEEERDARLTAVIPDGKSPGWIHRTMVRP